MPTQFNPNNQSAASNGVAPPSQPKLNLFQKWVDLVHEGCLKEIMDSRTYCQRAWVQETGKPASEATKVFMKSCTKDWAQYQTLARLSKQI